MDIQLVAVDWRFAIEPGSGKRYAVNTDAPEKYDPLIFETFIKLPCRQLATILANKSPLRAAEFQWAVFVTVSNEINEHLTKHARGLIHLMLRADMEASEINSLGAVTTPLLPR